MAKAREVKSRIANIKDIKQITKAMNAIAMAKVTGLKNRIEKSRPYFETLTEKKDVLLAAADKGTHPLLEDKDSEKLGVVTLNSDRGLAGNYTIDINRSTRDLVNSESREVILFAGGDKGERFFRDWVELEKSWVDFYTEPRFRHAEEIGSELVNRFLSGEMEEVLVVYMKYYSDLKQELTVEKVLPVAGESNEDNAKGDLQSSSQRVVDEYLYEPNKSDLIENFLREFVYEKIYWILLNTKTSEHAIRRRAMRDATNNANDLIDELTITYNKARQQQITREIADIIGGAEALRGEE